MERVYACIDLKSFYASVECVERNLDPLTTNLVVADSSRTNKTICLAVTPSLKQYGLSGRSRLYEVVKVISDINKKRRMNAPRHFFYGKSYNDDELNNNQSLEVDYIVAPPRMYYYMKYSTKIYNIYLKYISPDDIFAYSIDEVFCDLTSYLKIYKCTPQELVTRMIKDVYDSTGITATSGIGTNFYLAKIAMDIVAKHMKPNDFGVRLATLDEQKYKELLWEHTPITDFWRVGKGYQKRLEKYNILTMGDIARCSIENEDLLYKLFGINAEILIDHAWGIEPCTIEYIKKYKPSTNSLSSGQVLHEPYDYLKAKIIVREMIDSLVLDIVSKHLVTNHIVLTVGYDVDNLKNKSIMDAYDGEITKDFYGRNVPKQAHGTTRLDHMTSSTKIITDAAIKLYEEIVNKKLLIRRINIALCGLVNEDNIQNKPKSIQLDLFTNIEEEKKKYDLQVKEEQKEKYIQNAIIMIKNKYGKNAILKGTNLEKGSTAIERNKSVGGHKG